MSQAKAIQQFILQSLEKHSGDIVAVTAKHFNVSRTTVHRHLNKLLKENDILKTGTTRDIQYFLAGSLQREASYKIEPTLSEFSVVNDDFDTLLSSFSADITDVLYYGLTEIFNNAIDHSRGSSVTVSTKNEGRFFILTISDNGIGIFQKITDYFQLDDIRASALQLNKGKMTTDPANHTGEGLFFSSRIFTVFEIFANGLHYLRDNAENDWGFEQVSSNKKGTTVKMVIDTDCHYDLVALFKQFQDEDSLEFNRTEIFVELSKIGNERLVSRSQAKRITLGLEKFKKVTLDFSGIRMVGQGFVDEIFRIYKKKNPQTKITYINATDDIEYMIKRGK